MQFQVPQFIEVEDKIFGPLTMKQFIYLAGGGGLSLICFLLIPWWYISIIPIAAIVGISVALAFYKINNKPLVLVIEAAFKYAINPKLYIWKKEDPVVNTEAFKEKAKENIAAINYIPQITTSKLKDLTWNLSTKKEEIGEVEEEKAG